MQIHYKKCFKHFFYEVWNENKKFEIRYDDCNYCVGDILVLVEWDSVKEECTGRVSAHDITYLTDFKQLPGYVVLSTSLKENFFLTESCLPYSAVNASF